MVVKSCKILVTIPQVGPPALKIRRTGQGDEVAVMEESEHFGLN